MSAACRSCGAPIVWATTEKDRRIPLDAEPVETGNIVLRAGVAIYVKAGVDELFFDGVRYHTHYVTCPQSADWRKKK